MPWAEAERGKGLGDLRPSPRLPAPISAQDRHDRLLLGVQGQGACTLTCTSTPPRRLVAELRGAGVPLNNKKKAGRSAISNTESKKWSKLKARKRENVSRAHKKSRGIRFLESQISMVIAIMLPAMHIKTQMHASKKLHRLCLCIIIK